MKKNLKELGRERGQPGASKLPLSDRWTWSTSNSRAPNFQKGSGLQP